MKNYIENKRQGGKTVKTLILQRPRQTLDMYHLNSTTGVSIKTTSLLRKPVAKSLQDRKATTEYTCCLLYYSMPARCWSTANLKVIFLNYKKKILITEQNKDLNPKQYFKEIKHLIGIKWLLWTISWC